MKSSSMAISRQDDREQYSAKKEDAVEPSKTDNSLKMNKKVSATMLNENKANPDSRAERRMDVSDRKETDSIDKLPSNHPGRQLPSVRPASTGSGANSPDVHALSLAKVPNPMQKISSSVLLQRTATTSTRGGRSRSRSPSLWTPNASPSSVKPGLAAEKEGNNPKPNATRNLRSSTVLNSKDDISFAGAAATSVAVETLTKQTAGKTSLLVNLKQSFCSSVPSPSGESNIPVELNQQKKGLLLGPVGTCRDLPSDKSGTKDEPLEEGMSKYSQQKGTSTMENLTCPDLDDGDKAYTQKKKPASEGQPALETRSQNSRSSHRRGRQIEKENWTSDSQLLETPRFDSKKNAARSNHNGVFTEISLRKDCSDMNDSEDKLHRRHESQSREKRELSVYGNSFQLSPRKGNLQGQHPPTTVMAALSPHISQSEGPSNDLFSTRASSVFRGRSCAPSSAAADSESSRATGPRGNKELSLSVQYRPLHSLDSPSTLIDARQIGREFRNSGYDPNALSPIEPPHVHQSHHQHSPNSLFFAPQESPTENISPLKYTYEGNSRTVEMGPSFSFFNKSFESMAESGNQIGKIGLTHSLGSPATNMSERATQPQISSHHLRPSDQHRLEPLLLSPSLNEKKAGADGSLITRSGSGSGSDPNAEISFPNLYHSSSSNSGNGISPINSFGPVLCGSEDEVMGRTFHCTSSPAEIDPLPMGQCLKVQNPQVTINPNNGRRQKLRHKPRQSSGVTMTTKDQRSQHFLPGAKESKSMQFYVILRECRKAFDQCTFLLPGLRARPSETCTVNITSVGNIKVYSSSKKGHKVSGGKTSCASYVVGDKKHKAAFKPDPPMIQSQNKIVPGPTATDVAIATRRVASAICAFGGTPSKSSPFIFCGKEESHVSTPECNVPISLTQSDCKQKYEKELPNRYYESGNRLSWEVEEQPPVEIVTDDEDESINCQSTPKQGTHEQRMSTKHDGQKEGGSTDGMPKTSTAFSARSQSAKRPKIEKPNLQDGQSVSSGSEPPKMKYRCKLCGQPKQNHTCPYQQSLQRSIGTMVYPAVNAFTSDEPGELAPALSEMNNFITSVSDPPTTERSPVHPPSDEVALIKTQNSTGSGSSSLTGPGTSNPPAVSVTPEALRRKMSKHQIRGIHSPSSSLSTANGTPQGTPTQPQHSVPLAGCTQSSSNNRCTKREKKSVGSCGQKHTPSSPLLVDSVELRPEQYRIVSSKNVSPCSDAYVYPALPLPYAQRKRLSDSLFELSRKIPHLTDECAVVLREAREKNLWDLGVSELMAQILVAIHCKVGDHRLDGLHRHLLTLGIAC